MSTIARYVGVFAVLAVGGGLAHAADYPSKPVRLIVPFAPGGSTDIIARVLAQRMTDALGASVVVDNRAGAGGLAGSEMAVRSPADGYTLAFVSGSYATNAALYPLTYDPVNDITPVMMVSETAYLATVQPNIKVASVKELIAFAQAKPGALNYASAGNGSLAHLATELFNLKAGIKMTHIAYRGTGPAINDVLGGQVQVLFGGIPALIQHVKSGRLRGIGVTTEKRSSAAPDIPTIAETVPGYEASLWFGVWGPKGMPKSVVDRWIRELNRIAQMPEVQERMAGEGLDPVSKGPEPFRRVIAADVVKWKLLVERANLKN